MQVKRGRVIALATLVLTAVIAAAIAVSVPQYEADTWSCSKYNFQVLEDGTVQVENKSSSSEPAQSARVYINTSLTTTLSVPAMPAHTNWTTIGSVSVPSIGAFTWQVQGTSDCGDTGTTSNKVPLCHATASEVNPFNYISVAPSAVFSQGHDQHMDGQDIIPPFHYLVDSVFMYYGGLNWDSEGQAIWENKCEIPYTPTSAYVEVGSCRWNEEESLTPVSIVVNEGAKLTLDGTEYTSSTTVYLPPGHYSWYAVALEGYVLTGQTSEEFEIYSCRPGEAYAHFNVGVCEGNKRRVDITIAGGLTVYIFDPASDRPSEPAYKLTSSTTLILPPNIYKYLLVADESYELVVEEEGKFTVGSCETPQKPKCPTCGPPVWETSNGGMAILWYSDTPCHVCLVDGVWQIKLHTRVRIWSEIAFVLEYPAKVFHEPDVVSGADGVTYYVLDIDDHTANNAIIWGPDGQGDRYREHGQVYKDSACSVAPGYYDAPDGIALWKPGHTVMDWVKFLLMNGYFANEEHPGNAAIAWANQLRLEGSLTLPAN